MSASVAVIALRFLQTLESMQILEVITVSIIQDTSFKHANTLYYILHKWQM